MAGVAVALVAIVLGDVVAIVLGGVLGGVVSVVVGKAYPLVRRGGGRVYR
ncbi:hypothetical protein [Streptomyces sp. NPDC055060]